MTDAETSDEEIEKLYGQSGVQYRCFCGAVSEWQRDKRLIDAPSWNVRYEIVRRWIVALKTKKLATQTLTIYECPKCNRRTKL